VSTAAIPAAATGAPAPGQAAAKKKPAFHIASIRFKFIVFTVLLIALVMSAVGYSLYVQQSRALSREVLGRGRTIAENLAVASREVLLASENIDLLGLALLANRAVQQGGETGAPMGMDLRNPADILSGIKKAMNDLQVEVPGVIESGLSRLMGKPLNWGFEQARTEKLSVENEGVFEAVISGTDGKILSHYLGTSEVGKPYTPPRIVSPASGPDQPYPIYEQEVFPEGGKRFVRRLYDLETPIVEGSTGKTLGTVHLGVDSALVDRVVFNVTMKLAAIGLLAVLLGIVVTWLVVSYLTSPIGRLVNGVLAIAGGDFSTNVKVDSADELGELTNAFNQMAVSLSQNETLKGAFTRYVSDAALKQILSDPGKTGLHSQRVLATIYTSDVRGFTAMSETLEPEQVVQVINTYLSLQTEIILKFGGVVDKFIGDATIGVWGKETAGADDAINGVRAAFEAQAAIEKLNVERAARGEVVKLIGIGVNTGEVVSGNMGSSKKMEYTVTGEHVIFADQICAECPGGKVWISESTYGLVKDQVVVEKLEMKSKGHGDHGVTVYQVNGFK
jgi:class 3 adenylate cyclase/HAMP domain-containing protein